MILIKIDSPIAQIAKLRMHMLILCVGIYDRYNVLLLNETRMILFSYLHSNNDDLDIITFVTHLRIESTAATRYHSPTTNNTRET